MFATRLRHRDNGRRQRDFSKAIASLYSDTTCRHSNDNSAHGKTNGGATRCTRTVPPLRPAHCSPGTTNVTNARDPPSARIPPVFCVLLRHNEREDGLQTDGGELAARRFARAAIVAGAERQLDQHRRACAGGRTRTSKGHSEANQASKTKKDEGVRTWHEYCTQHVTPVEYSTGRKQTTRTAQHIDANKCKQCSMG
jgi:hypothetical protein